MGRGRRTIVAPPPPAGVRTSASVGLPPVPRSASLDTSTRATPLAAVAAPAGASVPTVIVADRSRDRFPHPPSVEILGRPSRKVEPRPPVQPLIETIEAQLTAAHIDGYVQQTQFGPTAVRFLILVDPRHGGRVEGMSETFSYALGKRVLVSPAYPYVALDLPLDTPRLVAFRDLVNGPEFNALRSGLPIPIGQDTRGKAVVFDLVQLPHVLIAGSSGSGKSNCLHSLVAGLLMAKVPSELEITMIDTKQTEFEPFYSGLPHIPPIKGVSRAGEIITTHEGAVATLEQLSQELDERNRLMALIGKRRIDHYNAAAREAGKPLLAHRVIVIDEFGDLLAAQDGTKRETERSSRAKGFMKRLATLGRSSGMHLVIATQKPSAEVMPTLITDNITYRCCFRLPSLAASQIVLGQGQTGATALEHTGDMLLFEPGGANGNMRHLRSPFITDDAIHRIVAEYRD